MQTRNLRQAAERERLMRQMELEEAGGGIDAMGRAKPPPQKSDRWEEKKKSSFPPDFPATSENEGKTPFELLEKYESIILGNIK